VRFPESQIQRDRIKQAIDTSQSPYRREPRKHQPLHREVGAYIERDTTSNREGRHTQSILHYSRLVSDRSSHRKRSQHSPLPSQRRHRRDDVRPPRIRLPPISPRPVYATEQALPVRTSPIDRIRRRLLADIAPYDRISLPEEAANSHRSPSFTSTGASS
jgi:hypothetical protein